MHTAERDGIVAALLKHLRANPGQTFSREELAAKIWQSKHYPASRTIDMAVCAARKQLGVGEQITAVHGRGYRYDAAGDSAGNGSSV